MYTGSEVLPSKSLSAPTLKSQDTVARYLINHAADCTIKNKAALSRTHGAHAVIRIDIHKYKSVYVVMEG